MLSFGLDAGFESFPPLVNGLVHNRLFQVSTDLNKLLLLLPWKPCSWYSVHTKLFKHNESTTEWQCTVWKIILGELILINLCRPALEVLFFIKHSVGIAIPEFRIPGSQPFSPIPNRAISGVPIPGFQYHKNYLKLYFFTRSLNYRNKNFNCPMNKIFYLQSTTACCAL